MKHFFTGKTAMLAKCHPERALECDSIQRDRRISVGRRGSKESTRDPKTLRAPKDCVANVLQASAPLRDPSVGFGAEAPKSSLRMTQNPRKNASQRCPWGVKPRVALSRLGFVVKPPTALRRTMDSERIILRSEEAVAILQSSFICNSKFLTASAPDRSPLRRK